MTMIREVPEGQRPINFTSKALQGPAARYQHIEKVALSLVGEETQTLLPGPDHSRPNGSANKAAAQKIRHGRKNVEMVLRTL